MSSSGTAGQGPQGSGRHTIFFASWRPHADPVPSLAPVPPLTPSNGSPVPYILFIAFVVVPLLEIFMIIQVGSVIGPVWTVGLLIFDSLVGAWLVKREGLRAWRNLTSTFERGQSPVDELTQGALVVFGGALLLTPGFITDVLGLACVLPLTRAPMSSLARRVAATVAARRMGMGTMGSTTVFMSSGGSSDDESPPRQPVTPTQTGPSTDADGRSGASSSDASLVPDVEVLEVERDDGLDE